MSAEARASGVFSSERFQDLLTRVSSYPWYEVAIEILLISIFIYMLYRFVAGTRAAGALKGLLVLVVLAAIGSRLLGSGSSFQRLGVLYDKVLALVAVGLIVIFQPELRRALVRLGEAPFFRSTPKDIALIVDEIVDAARYLSKSKFGALVVIERQVGLRGLTEGGTMLNAELSSRLLQTIFFPGSALHDLAVLVKGRVITAAGVQLPLAAPEDMPSPSLGSRHRAAVGLSRECDAIVVIVSEETGSIRIAERARLTGPYTPEQLREELKIRLGSGTVRSGQTAAQVDAENAVGGLLADEAVAAKEEEPEPKRAAG